MRQIKLVATVAALVLVMAACGGKSAEEALLEEILENSGEDISDIDINTDSGDLNLSIEGEDGEDISITGSGDDDEFEITVEGEDGGTLTIGGGDIPEALQLPVADGGKVTTSFSTETEVSVSLSYDGDQFDQLVAFYDSQLDPDSDDVDRNETSFTTEDGTFRNVYWSGEGGNWVVTVGDCIGLEPGSTCVTLLQTE
jgi:hypothetical protein